jgi:hypothetical protein
MATVRDIISDACQLVGILGQGEAQTDADAQLCLREANRMLGTWSNNRSLVFEIRDRTLALTSGTGAYSSALLGARPIKIENQSIYDSNGVQYPLTQVGVDVWTSIAYPASPGIPYWLYIAPGYPATVYNLFPVPIGGLTLHLYAWEQLTAFASLNTTIALPPGYEDALVYNLAVRFAPIFKKEAQASVIATAGETKLMIETVNLPLVESSLAMVPTSQSNNGYFDWRSGDPT